MKGRIPQDFIDQLLNRIDIVDLIDGYVPLKKAGNNYKACCPFHDEKSPSFTVSATKQFFHCFGCGENGTAISFLMKYDHMEFRDAIEKLASSAGLEMPTESGSHKPNKSIQNGIDLYKLMDKVSAFYQHQLRQHGDKQQAIDYLKKRGLSGDIAKRFELGFAPEGWQNLMQPLAKDEAHKKALLDTGMLTSNENKRVYDRFRHRIMFPIHDHRGRVVGFGGRVLDQGEPKYLNSPETPIFHKGSELYGLYAARGSIKSADNVLVVEGYMDVVVLAQHGVNNAVATLGTATTSMHLQRLFRHTKNITFCFDGDRAGKAAAWKALETCLPILQDGSQMSFLFLPDGEDPDSMVRQVGQQGFEQLIKEATPLPDFLTNHLQQQADINRLDGRAKLAQLAKPFIQKFPDGILKKLVTERIARLTQASAQDLTTEVPDTRSHKNHSRSPKRAQNTMPMTPIRQAISLVLQTPELAKKMDLAAWTEINIKGVYLLLEIVKQCQQNEHATTATLLERHRQESHFSALEKLASHDHMLEDDERSNAILGILEHLKHRSIEIELEQLLEQSKHEPPSEQKKQQITQLMSKLKQNNV